MADLNIEKFSPTKAELQAMADAAKQIELTNPLDEKQVEKVHDARLALRDARTRVAKMGKELREDALKFQKAVIAKEKEFIAIIEPEELRLDGMERVATMVQEREDRREFLPRRRERLAAIGDGIEISDDELLDMDGTAFEGYINKRLADKNEADRKRLTEEQGKLDKEKAEIARQEELRVAEERGRKEAAEKAEWEAKEKAEREARERKEAEERERQAKEKREKDERYQAFLKEHGYNPADFYTTDDREGKITLWKKVAVFDPDE